MTLEEKAELALNYFRGFSDKYKYSDVEHIGEWRGMDVFIDITPRKDGEIASGMPWACAVSNIGEINLMRVSEITSPDFPVPHVQR